MADARPHARAQCPSWVQRLLRGRPARTAHRPRTPAPQQARRAASGGGLPFTRCGARLCPAPAASLTHAFLHDVFTRSRAVGLGLGPGACRRRSHGARGLQRWGAHCGIASSCCAGSRSRAAQAENCFGTWLYTYAAQGAGLGPGVAATAVSLFWGAFTAGRLIAIPVSARLTPGAILLGSLPLAVLGPAVALLARGNVAALYVAAVAAGFGICTGAPPAPRRRCSAAERILRRLCQQRVAAVALRHAGRQGAGAHPAGRHRGLHDLPARRGAHRAARRAGGARRRCEVSRR